MFTLQTPLPLPIPPQIPLLHDAEFLLHSEFGSFPKARGLRYYPFVGCWLGQPPPSPGNEHLLDSVLEVLTQLQARVLQFHFV